MNKSELYHYGIPGMKWGVRRKLKDRIAGVLQRDSVKKLLKPRYIGLTKKQAERIGLNDKQRSIANKAIGLTPLAAQAGIIYATQKQINKLPPGKYKRNAQISFLATVAPTVAAEAFLIGRGLKRNYDIKKRLKEKEQREQGKPIQHNDIIEREGANMSYYNELYHYGIPGMKWGVRRYQKSDGSLTPAGAKRYGDGASSSGNSERKRIDKRKLARNIAIGLGAAAAVGGAAYGIHRLRKGVSGPTTMRLGRQDDFGNFVPVAMQEPKFDRYVSKGKEVIAERRKKLREYDPVAKALNNSFNGANPRQYDQPIGPLTRDQFIAKGRAARKAVDTADGKYDNKIGAFDRYVAKGKEVMAARAEKNAARKAANKANFDRYVAKGKEVMAARREKAATGKLYTKREYDALQWAKKARRQYAGRRLGQAAGVAGAMGAAAGAVYGGRKLAGRSKKRRK